MATPKQTPGPKKKQMKTNRIEWKWKKMEPKNE